MPASRLRSAFRTSLWCFSRSHSLTIFEGTATCTVPPSRPAMSVFRNHVRKLASDVPSSICTSAFCQSSWLVMLDFVGERSELRKSYTPHHFGIRIHPLLIEILLRLSQQSAKCTCLRWDTKMVGGRGKH